MSAAVRREMRKSSATGVSRDKSPTKAKGLTNEKHAYKPTVKKSLRTFIQGLKAMIDKKEWEKCKTASERALTAKTYGEIPQDARIYLHCGEANLKLGYLLIAEQMLQKCMPFPEIQGDAQR